MRRSSRQVQQAVPGSPGVKSIPELALGVKEGRGCPEAGGRWCPAEVSTGGQEERSSVPGVCDAAFDSQD